MKEKVWAATAVLLLAAPLCFGYSFLTHEAIVDMAWQTSIKPVLLRYYPHATPAQLREARAYAYGGSTIQDAGYYPFGHSLFSDLTHYVRTGDFVVNLIRQSRNIDDLAFALGALSHYVGDTIGHRYCVNISVPLEFHQLEQVYGPVVTYEENEHDHVRTEFAFDIDQLSRRRFASVGYRRSIGIRVPRRLLERAFYDTYGISLRSVLGNEFAALRSYRWALRDFLPRIAAAEVLLHRKSLPPDVHDPQFAEFQQRLRAAARAGHWAAYRREGNGFLTHAVAALIFITPRIGPLSDVALRGPEIGTEENYVASVNRAVDLYGKLLGELAHENRSAFSLPDLDLDTGYITRPGYYRLTDITYARLLHRVTERKAMPPAGLRRNILAYYSNPAAPIVTRQYPRRWKRIQQELATLRAMPATRIPQMKQVRAQNAPQAHP
jgi:hypothetical protein